MCGGQLEKDRKRVSEKTREQQREWERVRKREWLRTQYFSNSKRIIICHPLVYVTLQEYLTLQTILYTFQPSGFKLCLPHVNNRGKWARIYKELLTIEKNVTKIKSDCIWLTFLTSFIWLNRKLYFNQHFSDLNTILNATSLSSREHFYYSILLMSK